MLNLTGLVEFYILTLAFGACRCVRHAKLRGTQNHHENSSPLRDLVSSGHLVGSHSRNGS